VQSVGHAIVWWFEVLYTKPLAQIAGGLLSSAPKSLRKKYLALSADLCAETVH
jgi:hypothetical protein